MSKPLISVIIPVYNSEEYLKDAINSVIGQSIGFKKSTEIILVDDGSQDRSGEICKEYGDRYPGTIRYMRQKNSGVSKARNVGLEAARGEFVHFLDSDDIISSNFYRHTLRFLKQHPDDIDFVAVKIKFFDAIIDSHPLNNKFSKSRVIDLDTDPDNPILHMATCVFRANRIKDMRFDERLSISEDAKFLSDILLQKRKYGVVKRPTYYYRKRDSGGSAIEGKERNKNYYTATPRYAYQRMLDSWRKSENSQPIEYTLLYDISYRLDQKSEDVLSDDEREAYKKSIKDILRSLNEEVVASHSFLSVHKKLYILRLMYGDSLGQHLSWDEGTVKFKGISIYNHQHTRASIDFLKPLGNERYKIEGYINDLVGDIDKYRLLVSGKEISLRPTPRAKLEKSFLGDIYSNGGAFEAEFNVSSGDSLRMIVAKGSWRNTLPMHTRTFTRLASYPFSYRCDHEYIIQKSPHTLIINKRSWWRHVLFELRHIGMILLNWRLSAASEQFRKMNSRNFKQLTLKGKVFEALKPALIIAESVAMIPRDVSLRAVYNLSMMFKSRPVWIVSDRGMSAGDNGEAMFRYIMEQKDCPADVYFALSKKSKDYERLRKIGPVLSYGGLKYKLKFLLADKIISSHADVEVTNPFLRQVDRFVDLYTFDFVFLQHGIIRNNLSEWLNRYEKNIAVFITSAEKEYDSILRYPYYYKEDNLILSGLPRYDYLVNNPKKKLIIAPTYRNHLLRGKTDRYGARAYDNLFKDSKYFRFYNRLINDEKILSALEKAGMVGEFYLHPNLSAQTPDFHSNDTISVMSYPYDYKKAISEGALLVSDYSSVVFDFAYLGKPVVYAQFDEDSFYAHQPYDKADFYSDEADGFGPVLKDYKTTVTAICEVIERGCTMQELYSKRVDGFFTHRDTNNSHRVYHKIL